jgi:hypothetical protein
MKKLIIASLLSACFMACNSEKKDSTADSSKTDTNVTADNSSTPVDTAAANKAWAEYMTPGNMHKMMAKSNGMWNVEMSMYYSPGTPPSVSKMSCENKMILGGRYQQSTYNGTFENMHFEGLNTLAYDNARKVYVSTWIDNMGTGIMNLEGTYDEATKTMNMKGKSIDVPTGKEIQIRETMQFIDDNNQLMEMFDTKDGKETKSMSIKLTRAK